MAETLRDVVDAHAHALVAGDVAAFASMMHPRTLTRFRLDRFAQPASHEIVEIYERGQTGTSEVRFGGRDAFTLRATWHRDGAGWRIADAAVSSAPLAWWRRVLSFAR